MRERRRVDRKKDYAKRGAMNDKTKERINKLSILVGLLKSVGIGLPDYVIELTNDLIKIVEEKPEPRSVNSVKLCPYCQGIPKKEFVYDTVTSKRKLRLLCPHCGERPGKYSYTFDEMISDWNEWASIDENGDEQ